MQEGQKPKIESYRDLTVWQKGMDLVVESYRLASQLPSSEIYGLSAQIRRAAVSAPANIAEGHGRHHTGDFVHHLSMANGSLRELETLLLIAVRLRFLQPAEIGPALDFASQVGRMLTTLMRKLREREK